MTVREADNVETVGATPASPPRPASWLARNWLLTFLAVWGAVNLLPWLAPLFMELGWEWGGRAIYTAYTALCHQLPQRSYFLFGAQPMYELPAVQAVWENTDNPLILRQFVGNAEMGWKVAWSDRMVSLYTGLLLWAALLGPWRRRLPRLPLWALALMVLPLAVDGVTHTISDFIGIGASFRYDNAGWLAPLTGGAFGPGFYVGNGIGTFNWWARLITGLLAALGAAWFALPLVEEIFGGARRVGAGPDAV